MSGLDDLGNALPIKDIYEDLAKPAVREAGSAIGNVVKVARFILAPIDYLAAQHGRWQRYLERVAQKVPDEKRIDAHPQLAGPVLEGLRYTEEGSLTAELFLNLLARAIDRDRVDEAHPAFASIIAQLSPDEALVLYHLRKRPFKLTQTAALDPDVRLFSPRTTVENEFPTRELAFPNNFFMYMDHLHSLNLAGVGQQGNQEATYEESPRRQTGVIIRSSIALTPFGELFSKACVPEDLAAVHASASSDSEQGEPGAA